MSKKRKIQITVICLLLLAVILLIPSTKWSDLTSILAFVSLALGTLGSIISIFIPTVYNYLFSESDWKQDISRNEYYLEITSKQHGIGKSPQVQIFVLNKNGFELIITDAHHDDNGNVIIITALKFTGKVSIT